MFLGQLPEKYKDIKEAPFSMRIPILTLSFVVLLFGILPGIPLKIINAIGTSFGLEPLNVNIWGIASETGALNTVNISFAVLIAGIIVWMFLRVGKRSIPVSQRDSYAAGAYIPKEKYHYTVKFYDPLFRVVKRYIRDFVDVFYSIIVKAGRKFSGMVRKIYSGDLGYYVIYILLFLAILIIIKMGLALW
jgi:NADH-quinone oxidoreductase subunit M